MVFFMILCSLKRAIFITEVMISIKKITLYPIYFELPFFQENTYTTSPVMGGILCIEITVMLAVLVLLLFQIPNFFLLQDSEVPAFFKITKIRHTNEKEIMNFDS